jgi:hypothetical protein
LVAEPAACLNGSGPVAWVHVCNLQQ